MARNTTTTISCDWQDCTKFEEYDANKGTPLDWHDINMYPQHSVFQAHQQPIVLCEFHWEKLQDLIPTLGAGRK